MMTVKISTNRPIATFTTLCCVPAWAPCSCSPCPPVPLRWWRGQWPAGRGQCRGGRCQLSHPLGWTPAGQISTKQKTIVRCVTISTSHLVTCLLVRTCLFAFTCSRLTSTLPWERDDQQSTWKLNVCYQMLILKSFFSDFTSNHPGSHGVRLTSSIVSRGGDGTDSGRESKYKFLQFRY